MTELNGARQAERWLDEVIISATATDVDGDATLNISNPQGMGDLAIMELMVYVVQVATLVANPELLGVRATIIDPNANVDIIGVERWSRCGTAELAAYLSPDPLVLWRQGERVQLLFEEVDTNVAPTADVTVVIKAVRVHPVEATRGPIQLVR